MLRTSSVALVFSALLALSVTTANGQGFLLSPENLDKDGMEFAKVLGNGDDGYYVLLSNLPIDNERTRTGLRLRKNEICFFGTDLRLKWKKPQNPIPASGDVDACFVFQGKVACITRVSSKGTGEMQFFMQVFNANGEQTVREQLVYSQPYKKGSSFGGVKSLTSGENDLFVIAFAERDESGIQIHACASDSTFRPIWQRNWSLSGSSEFSSIGDWGLLDEARFYCLASRPVSIPGRKREESSAFSLHVFDLSKNAVSSFSFNTENQSMQEAAVVHDRKNSRLLLAGFISDNTSYSGVSLLCGQLSLDTLKELQTIRGRISLDEQKKLIGRRNSGGSIGLDEYPIRRLWARSDGGLLLIAESITISETAFYDYFTQTYNRRIEYHFDNIVILSVNPDGTTDWSQVIEKEQRSLDDEGLFSSFNTLLLPDELVLVYGRNPGRYSELFLKSVRPDGTTQAIRSAGAGEQFALMPRFGKQVDENLFLGPAQHKKKLFLVKISL